MPRSRRSAGRPRPPGAGGTGPSQLLEVVERFAAVQAAAQCLARGGGEAAEQFGREDPQCGSARARPPGGAPRPPYASGPAGRPPGRMPRGAAVGRYPQLPQLAAAFVGDVVRGPGGASTVRTTTSRTPWACRTRSMSRDIASMAGIRCRWGSARPPPCPCRGRDGPQDAQFLKGEHGQLRVGDRAGQPAQFLFESRGRHHVAPGWLRCRCCISASIRPKDSVCRPCRPRRRSTRRTAVPADLQGGPAQYVAHRFQPGVLRARPVDVHALDREHLTREPPQRLAGA